MCPFYTLAAKKSIYLITLLNWRMPFDHKTLKLVVISSLIKTLRSFDCIQITGLHWLIENSLFQSSTHTTQINLNHMKLEDQSHPNRSNISVVRDTLLLHDNYIYRNHFRSFKF